MKIKSISIIIMVLFLVTAIMNDSYAQTQIKIPITASNLISSRTINFGWDVDATHCIDQTLGEREYPPKPPSDVFDFRFIDYRTPPCFGEGVVIDLKKLITNQTKIDTFILAIQHGEGGVPVALNWPIINNPLVKGLILQDGFGGIYFSVNMLAAQSVEIQNTQITTVYIYSTTGTNIKQEQEFPVKFALEQNYPNPFNPITNIKFSIPVKSDVEIVIYDLMGRRVRTLVSENLTPGVYSIEWNGRDDYDKLTASGIYSVRLHAQTDEGKIFSETKKVILLK